MKFVLFLFFLIFFSSSYSQQRVSIQGKINLQSKKKIQIHIYNKTSKKGTLSTIDGLFEIQAKERDTLIISAITFDKVIEIVNKKNLLAKRIDILVFDKGLDLPQVTISNHNLTGSIFTDRNRVPDSFEKYTKYSISTKEINPNAVNSIDTPNQRKLVDPLRTSESVNSVDFIKIYKLLTSGLRQKRLEKKRQQAILKKIPITIKNEFSTTFFIEKLNIPKILIEDFIVYCMGKYDIKTLFLQNKKIEILEIFNKEKTNYLQLIKASD